MVTPEQPRCPDCKWTLAFRAAGYGRWAAFCWNPFCQTSTVKSPTLYQRIQELHSEGLTAKDIAETAALSENSVRQTLSRARLETNPADLGRGNAHDWVPQKHTDEELLQDLRRLAQLQGGPLSPSTNYQRKHGAYPSATYVHRWGSFNAAKRAAGLPCRDKDTWKGWATKKYTDEDCFRAYGRVKKLEGRRPSFDSYTLNHTTDEPSSHLLRARWGKWSTFVTEAEAWISTHGA